MSNSTAPTHIPVTKLWTESFKRTWKDWRFVWAHTLVYLVVSLIVTALFFAVGAVLATPVVFIGMATESVGVTSLVAVPAILLFSFAIALIGWLLQAFLMGATVGSLRLREPGMHMTFKTVWNQGKMQWKMFRDATRLRLWYSFVGIALLLLASAAVMAIVYIAEDGRVDEEAVLLSLIIFTVLFSGAIVALSFVTYMIEAGLAYASFAALTQKDIRVPRQSTKVGFGFLKRNVGATLGSIGLMFVGVTAIQTALSVIQLPLQLISIIPILGIIIYAILFIPLMILSAASYSFTMIWACDLFMRLYQDRQPNATIVFEQMRALASSESAR